MHNQRTLNIALWVLQGLLALFFAVGSGAPKFFLPDELLNMPIPLPRAFLYFIGAAEILGSLGLILPGMLRTQPGIAPLAATGLVLLTLCATAYQLLARQPESAVFAFVMCLLSAFVAYGRWRLVPLRKAPRRSALQQAS